MYTEISVVFCSDTNAFFFKAWGISEMSLLQNDIDQMNFAIRSYI